MFTIAISKEEELYLQKGVPFLSLMIFRTIVELEAYVEKNPTILKDLVLIENSFEFNNSNIDALIRTISSAFFSMEEKYIYYYVNVADYDRINNFIKNNDKLKDILLPVPVDQEFSREVVLRILKYEFRKVLNQKAKATRIVRTTKREHYDRTTLNSTEVVEDFSVTVELAKTAEDIELADAELNRSRLRISNADSVINKKYLFLQDKHNSKIVSTIMMWAACRLKERGRVLLFENDFELYLSQLFIANKVDFVELQLQDFKDIGVLKTNILNSPCKIVLVTNKYQNELFNIDALSVLVDTFMTDIIYFTLISKQVSAIEVTSNVVIYPISNDVPSVMKVVRENADKLENDVNFILVNDALLPVPVLRKELFVDLMKRIGVNLVNKVQSILINDKDGAGDAIHSIVEGH